MFEQTSASVALLRRIKVLCPETVTVIGGANCEAEMGFELHRSFPWIDFVCTGEGEAAFVELVEASCVSREPFSAWPLQRRPVGEFAG